MTAEAVSLDGEPSAMPMEFIQLPVVHETSLDVPSLQVINVVQDVSHEVWERIRKRANGVTVRKTSSTKHSMPRTDVRPAKPVLMQPNWK